MQGLLALKSQVIIATLSNGNVRLLIDMVNGLFLLSSFEVTDFLCYRRSIRIFLGIWYFPQSCLIRLNRPSSPLSTSRVVHLIFCFSLSLFFPSLSRQLNRNPKAYLQAVHHLSLPPSQCAMVAAHIHDLRAAAGQGMKTVYVRRVGEDPIVKDGEMVKSKDEGGEVDCVVDSFLELSEVFSSVQ